MDLENIKKNIDHKKARNAIYVLLAFIIAAVLITPALLIVGIIVYIGMCLSAIDLKELNK